MTNFKKISLSLAVASAFNFSGCGSSSSDDTTSTDTISPVFISSTTATVIENQTSAIDVNATDTNTVTYTLNSGDDKALFDINSSSGVLTFKTAPDYENPIDSNNDNNYSITVSATDVAQNTATQNIVISVSNDTADDIAESTVSGKVADGYLDKAKVCLDKNENGKCDTDEPNTLSVNGQYDLNITTTDVGKYPILVEVTTSTVDLDDNLTVTNGYTLTAPKDSTGFISPITTLIQNEIEKCPALTKDEATLRVSKKLNITSTNTKLLTDYVANNSDSESSKLHEVGKVVATLQGSLEQKISQSGIDITTSNKKAVVSQILDNIYKDINNSSSLIANGTLANAIDTTTKVTNTTISNDDISVSFKKIELAKIGTVTLISELINRYYFAFDRDDETIRIDSFIINNTKTIGGQGLLSNGVVDIEVAKANIINNPKHVKTYNTQSDNSLLFSDNSSVNRFNLIPLENKSLTIREVIHMIGQNKYLVESDFSNKLDQVINFTDETDEMYHLVISIPNKVFDSYKLSQSAMTKVITALE